MKLAKYLFFPALALIAGLAYWALSYEMAGVVLLLVFAGAMAFFMWVLVPTFDHEGNTAPIDPDFKLPEE
jgi:NADH:ubiquinone oxidoreductase subunit 6 (subunit J)